jgi:hypothetical protein
MKLSMPYGPDFPVGPEIWKILTARQWDELYGLTALAIDDSVANEILHKAVLPA